MRSRNLLVVLMLCSCGLQAGPAVADVFSYVDGRGIVHLTDQPTDSRYRLLFRSRKRTDSLRANREKSAIGVPYNAVINQAANRHGVHSALIKAVIQAESGFNPLAVSRKGAVGLMQLMPVTARRYGVVDRLDPTANIEGGVRMLRDLLDRYDDNLHLSLAAYNAGEYAVKKYGNEVPPYPETREYVAKVLKFYKQYRQSM